MIISLPLSSISLRRNIKLYHDIAMTDENIAGRYQVYIHWPEWTLNAVARVDKMTDAEDAARIFLSEQQQQQQKERRKPLDFYRVVDTTTGKIVQEREFDVPPESAFSCEAIHQPEAWRTCHLCNPCPAPCDPEVIQPHICCDKMKEFADVYWQDGEWQIFCEGQYFMRDLKYCPWCAKPLEEEA